MNVCLRKLMMIAGGLLLSVWGWGQAIQLPVYQNVTATYSFVSTPNNPGIVTAPAHGVATLTKANPGVPSDFHWVLSYTPNENYIGIDFIKISYFSSPSSLKFAAISITVEPAKVTAVHDYATTMTGVPVDIEVLANDFSSNGAKQIAAIPLVNNGTAEYTPGNSFISFTPAPGFKGLAHFNYVVCDGAGTCDHGTVSVNVLGSDMPSQESFQIFIKKNQSQDVLVPDVFTLSQGPLHGVYSTDTDVPQYTPVTNYTGNDQMTFVYDNHQITVNIKVLDIEQNDHAFDDNIYTTSYESVEFDVLENDLYGHTANSVVIHQPQHGSIQILGEGIVNYTPAPGFTGVDVFTYSSNAPGGDNETATVRVYVSNYEPAAATFRMATPKQTPLIIGYNVPITDFDFAISDQGELGTAEFYPGEVNMTIYGVPITGYNLIIYTPNEEVISGEDHFEVTYCVTDETGNCAYQKTVKVDMDILDVGAGDGPMCFGDCVWAGDTNFDGTVNMEDLLPLGLYMGEIGSSRPDVNFNYWYGQYAPDWSDLFQQNPINLKHLDTDGDSIVTALDTIAIREFYGRTHSLTAAKVPFYNFDIELDGDVFINPGDLVELNINVGSSANPAVDVYGFAFPFLYDTTIVKPGSVKVEFYNSSWLSYNSPILFMSHNDGRGKVDAGYTRTSGIAATGFGNIGKVSFIVADELAGFRPDGDEIVVPVGGGDAKAMSSSGEIRGVHVLPHELHIRVNKSKKGPEAPLAPVISPNLLKVYPNPSQGLMNVRFNGGNQFEYIRLFNMTGQIVFDSGALNTNKASFDFSDLPEGLYILEAETEQGPVRKKVEIVR